MIIAVSACLLGVPCRYDGGTRPCEAVGRLQSAHDVVPICPESMAGLPIPRLPNELVAEGDGFRVVDSSGIDNTEAFLEGARCALKRVREAGCELAVLKSKSPSCGSGRIYDGTFTGTLADGWGVAARMLADAGIPVIDEGTLEQLAAQCGGIPDDDALRCPCTRVPV